MYKGMANKPTGSARTYGSLERHLIQVFLVMSHINPPVVGTSTVTPSTFTDNTSSTAVASGPSSKKYSATGVCECKEDKDSSDEEPSKCGMFM